MKLNLNTPPVPAAFLFRYNGTVPAGILKRLEKIQRRAYKIDESKLFLRQFIPYLNLKALMSI